LIASFASCNAHNALTIVISHVLQLVQFDAIRAIFSWRREI
jgi:hypothetical protein